jgi:hypothetical protein
MAQLWKLTQDEQDKMMDLKMRLRDVDYWKNDPYEVIRFLKECQGDVPATEQKFRGMVAWRRSEDIDDLLPSYQPDRFVRYFPSVVLEGVDHENDPIVL